MAWQLIGKGVTSWPKQERAGKMTVAIVIGLSIIVLQFATLNFLRSLTMDVATILTQIATVSADLDALIAKVGPGPDLQPVADALTALDDKIKTAAAG